MAEARADAELVRRGLARSRRHAVALVTAGRVTVAGATVTKPSSTVLDDAVIAVVPDPDDPNYASRAGGKLAGALDALAADPEGRTLTDAIAGARCLDLGASTGGFTDVLLRRGAAHVDALDVGHDQIVPALRADPRVSVVEGFNVRDLTADDLDARPDVVVGDLSFISLTLVLAAVAAAVGPRTELLLLVKPQFEVGRDALGSGGVVRDPAQHERAVLGVVRAAAVHGLRARAVVPSPLPGPSGNREFFCWFRPGGGPDARPGTAGESPGQEPADAGGAVAAVRAATEWRPVDEPRAADGSAGSVSTVDRTHIVPPVLMIGGAA